jgi:hypothetical protein
MATTPVPQVLNIKQGATLSQGGLVPQDVLYPGGTWTAKSEAVVRGKESVRFTLTATLTPPVAPSTDWAFLLFAPASATELWPIGKLLCDVDFIDSAASPEPFVISSETFTIVVEKDITE